MYFLTGRLSYGLSLLRVHIGWAGAGTDSGRNDRSDITGIGKDIGERVSNVVVMGTGEPLDNFENLLRFIRAFDR